MGFFVTSIGDYPWNVIPMGFLAFNERGDGKYQRGWTIREFMVGIMFVLAITAFFWLCIFGGNAIYMELHATGGIGTVV